MASRRTISCVAAVLVAVALGGTARAAEPKIQVALLLDNSGSMSGLINQAKNQLWTFVNEFATSRKGGRPPRIEVALYTYGSPPPTQLVALTDDLDLVSERLFAVGISGSTEYCGYVIQEAAEKLAWSDSPEDLKVIFIAGNEPFTQGPVDYREACKAAVAKGIIVNTIHCGSGVPDDWKAGALLAEGTAMSIDQNRAMAHIEAPQDTEIVRLGQALNETYLPYGANGAEGRARQLAQNGNAENASHETNVQRYVAQSQVQYRNGAWDLVDAAKDGTVKVEELEEDQLPEKMQKMTAEQRVAFVEKNAARRAEIQTQINELNEARRKYVAAERKKLAASGESLDSAMIQSLRAQAAKRNFEFEVPTGSSEESTPKEADTEG